MNENEILIAGIDYSLNGPCICVFRGKTYDTPFGIKDCYFYFLTNTKSLAKTFDYQFIGTNFDDYSHDCQRYESIADWALEKVEGSVLVGLEGYAFGASGRAIFQIAENCGLLKYKLYQNRLPVEVIPPTSVKKLATGKGNATKEKMVKQFQTDTKINLQKMITPNRSSLGSPVTDIVDAYYICKMAYESYQKSRALSK